MNLNNFFEVLHAYYNGQIVQYRPWNSNQEWKDLYKDVWDLNNFEYRIKPKPTHTPYTLDVLKKDVTKHNGWVMDKKTKDCYAIGAIIEKGCVFAISSRIISYSTLLNDYVWLDDNSPCGIKIKS